MMSETLVSTYIKPISTISSGWRSTSEAMTYAPPSAKEPVSPMNTRAGYVLKRRKPMHAPAVASASTITTDVASGSSPALFINSAISPSVTMTTVVTEELRPSTPSMRLTELVVARITNAAKGMYHTPRSHWMCVKGT